MKNITLSADERLIERARAKARAQRTSLNHLFRDWLRGITEDEERCRRIDALLDRMESVDAGGTFTREEMNAR
jgi:hypothetical protein